VACDRGDGTRCSLERLGYLRCDERLYAHAQAARPGTATAPSSPARRGAPAPAAADGGDRRVLLGVVLDGDETLCVACRPAHHERVPVGTRLRLRDLRRARAARRPDPDQLAATRRVELRARRRPPSPARRPCATSSTRAPPALRRVGPGCARRRPIRDTAGRVVAAANVGALAGRVTIDTLRRRRCRARPRSRSSATSSPPAPDAASHRARRSSRPRAG
jgi:hypothetical protein